MRLPREIKKSAFFWAGKRCRLLRAIVCKLLLWWMLHTFSCRLAKSRDYFSVFSLSILSEDRRVRSCVNRWQLLAGNFGGGKSEKKSTSWNSRLHFDFTTKKRKISQSFLHVTGSCQWRHLLSNKPYFVIHALTLLSSIVHTFFSRVKLTKAEFILSYKQFTSVATVSNRRNLTYQLKCPVLWLFRGWYIKLVIIKVK